MFKITMAVLTLFLMPSAGKFAVQDAVKPLPTIEVTAPPDVKSVRALDGTMDALSRKVTACVSAGRQPDTCPCRYPDDVSRLRKQYETLVEQHPSWKDRLLSYEYVNEDGRKISGLLVLENLRRQLDVLKCGSNAAASRRAGALQRDQAPFSRDGRDIAVSHGSRCHDGPPEGVKMPIAPSATTAVVVRATCGNCCDGGPARLLVL